MSPTTTYDQTKVTINGAEFGSTASTIVVTLTLSLTAYLCSSPTWVSSTVITCVMPSNLPAGPFSLGVNVGGQNSSSTLSGMHLLSPVVSAISTNTGPAIGGTSFTLTVTNLFSFVSVNFNYTLTTPPTVRQANCNTPTTNTITCTSPSVPFSAIYS